MWNSEVLHIINIYCKKCYKIWKCSVLFSGPWFTGSVKRLSLLFFRFLTILPWLNTADVVTLELLKIILKCSLKIDVVLFYLSFKSWNWCSKVAQCGIFDSIKDLCWIHFLMFILVCFSCILSLHSQNTQKYYM